MDKKKIVIENEEQLDELLSIPSANLIEMMKTLKGDIMILGIAGKMGITLGKRAINAINQAKVDKKVYGVARFSNPESKAKLESFGIIPIACDLLNIDEVKKLPQIENVIFMAGRKFGTDGSEDLTWAMNTLVPGNVVAHFEKSKIVVFSTGCVYPLVEAETGGCTEDTPINALGEYSQSCLGRERIFQYGARKGTNILIYRLNYAIDMRYGVLHDIAQQVYNEEVINDSVKYFNLIWQGDANDIALLSLNHCSNPANIMNVTGSEIVTLEYVVNEFSKLFNKKVKYANKPGSIAYLNNAQKCFDTFGYPKVSLQDMIEWQAQWILQGGSSLGKPTHFEVNTGKF